MSNRFQPFVLIYLLLATSCAIQVAPTGGEKDVAAPELKKAIPENFSTRFKGRDITLAFDEYITLKDLGSQFVVSPPLKYPPETKAKKKTLHIHLDDTLLENTTYTLNFGDAITDIHEGNPVADFQYVFSTGDVLDSLTISGKVENAFDKKTEKGICVMLYRGTQDSLPLKTPPDYFAKTSENGRFEVKNVSPGSYKVFALKDNNSNYLFDNNEEAVAFHSERLDAGKETVTLGLFKETRKQQLLKASCDEPGRVTVAYARSLFNERLVYLSDTASMQFHALVFSEKRDTIWLWYRNQQSDSLNFILQHEDGSDTIRLRLKNPETKGKAKSSPALTTQYIPKTENSLGLSEPLQLVFNHPMDSFDLSRISVVEDSVPIQSINLFFTDSLKKNLTIDFPRKETVKYTVGIPAGTMKDIFGMKNDSLQYLFRTKAMTDYGTMAIRLNTSSARNYFIVQLIDDKETVYRESPVRSDTLLNYNFLEPKIYRLKLIEDLNGNHKWDPGNYLQNLQPERVFYYKENLTVRANWDVDVNWPLVIGQ